MLNKLRIGKKLTLGFGIVIMLLLALTIVMAYSFSKITKSTDDVQSLFERSVKANEAIDSVHQMRRNFLLYLATHEPKLSDDFDTDWKATIAAMEEIRDKTLIEKNKLLANEILEFLSEVKTMKGGYLEQEKVVAGLRDQCSGTSGKVVTGLDDTMRKVHEMVKKTASSNDQGEPVVEMSKVELEKSLLEKEVLVGRVLAARDNFIYSTKDSDRDRYEQLIGENMKKLAEGLEEIKPLLPQDEISTGFEKVMQDRVDWDGIAKNYIKSIKDLRSLQDPLLLKIRSSIDKCNTFLSNISEQISYEGEKQHRVIVSSQTVGYTVSAVAIFVAILMSWMLTQSVSGGVTGIVNLFRKITGEGDVTVTIHDTYLLRPDEVGELARQAQAIITDFRSVTEVGQAASRGDWTYKIRIKGEKDEMNKNLAVMFDQVNEVLQQVHSSVQQVSAGASQVNSASESLAQGATESAASLEEITSSMTEMGSQTHQNAQNASEASQLAKTASGAANNGQTMMKQMINSMEQITKNSQDVQKVVKVIDDIAFQTNLLALNAAVEAARAGIHGKGFAVVAEEVRNLAARCAKAAGETTQMIENNNRQIKDGAEIAKNTADMLDQIVSQVASTTNLIHEIAAASNEQAQGVSQVTQALQQIDAVTQQNSASAEETASVSSEMNSHVSNLQKVMERFTLRNVQSQHKSVGLLPQEGIASFSDIAPISANRATSKPRTTIKKTESNSASHDTDDNWGGETATSVMPNQGEPDYNFKLDDREFGKF